MGEDAGEVLGKLIELATPRGSRSRRLAALLRPRDAEHADGWGMCVPPCFNDALDIRLTQRMKDKKPVWEWTGGANFCFKAGDRIYDSPEAYSDWPGALKKISVCFSIQEADPVTAAGPEVDRNPGRVRFAVLEPDRAKKRLVKRGERTVTQDEFVLLLIEGLGEGTRSRTSTPSGTPAGGSPAVQGSLFPTDSES